jgi:hypothetical protein
MTLLAEESKGPISVIGYSFEEVSSTICAQKYSPDIRLTLSCNFFFSRARFPSPGHLPLKFCTHYLFPSPSYKARTLHDHRCRCGNNSQLFIDRCQVPQSVMGCISNGFFRTPFYPYYTGNIIEGLIISVNFSILVCICW